MTTRRRRALDDLDEEMRDHIARETEDLVARGVPPDEAHRQALVRFGNLRLAQEDVRAVWVPIWIEQLVQDMRHGCRALRRSPAHGTAVILTLALAVGMNTAIFSAFNAVLLRPIPYPEPERLVWLSLHGETPFGAVPASEFVAWRERATSFDLMAAFESTQDHILQSAAGGTQVRNAWVSEDFWALAGARAASGRVPRPGEQDVLVLAHGFHQQWFGDDDAVVGRAVTVNGRQIEIVGVLGGDFRLQLPQEALGPLPDRKPVDVYRPYSALPAGPRGSGVPVRVVARLVPGMTIERARAELDEIRATLAASEPVPALDRAVLSLLPLQDRLVRDSRPTLWMLMVAVLFVLVIASANVASLLLARAMARSREMAVRMAIGAGPGRVLRQLLGEGLVLAIPGGAAGVLLAAWGLDLLMRLMPHEAVPRLADAAIDGAVLAFALGTSLLTALCVGLAPARWALRGQGMASSRGVVPPSADATVTGRKVLLAVQLALTVVLLTGAGLMLKSVWRMHAYPAGFEPWRILTAQVMFTAPDYVDRQPREAYVDELLRRLTSEPAVDAAAIFASGGASPAVRLTLDGTASASVGEAAVAPAVHLYATSAQYARAMGLGLLQGRWFGDDEPAPVAVISDSVSRRELSDMDPIGRRLDLCFVSAPGAPCPVLSSVEVVGVVPDVKHSRLDAAPVATIYVPYRHYPRGFFRFTPVIRTTIDPPMAAGEIRTVILGLDRTLPVFDLMTLERALAGTIALPRVTLALLGIFAGAALLLALLGTYGLVAYAVARRTREIAIRLALGATRGAVMRMVLREWARLTAIGVAAGTAGALALTQLMQALLFDVEPTDAQTFAVAGTGLAAAALLACCGAAIRASRVDLLVALRCE